MRTVTVHGFPIRVSVRPGSGRRTPLLLCCGIGAGFEAFTPFVDSLDPEIEVIRFDVPGAGASPPGAVPIGFPGHAFLAARLLTALGHRRADVLGFSWGGGLAQQLALQHRTRVRRLVLVATGTGAMMVPGRPEVLARMLTPRRFRDEDYAASLAGTLYGGSARGRPGQVRSVLGDATRVGSRRGYVHQLLAGAVWTSLPFLPLVGSPTLVLSGDDDPIIPVVNAHLMHRMIRGSQLEVYPGGHLTLVTDVDVLTPVITRFLHPDL
jgi:poly(3-hydroxyalkanoate) depolymerase